jgi:hypothetical protein
MSCSGLAFYDGRGMWTWTWDMDNVRLYDQQRMSSPVSVPYVLLHTFVTHSYIIEALNPTVV